MPKSTAVLKPNLGLYLDRPSIALNERMLTAGHNFRVSEGKLTNIKLGWSRMGDFTLNGPVMMIDNFRLRSGTEHLLFATLKDLYLFDPSTETVSFLTPRYETGTASASGTSVTGSGTTWSTNAKAGDYIHFGASGQTDPEAVWFEIDAVGGDTSITLTADAGTVANGAYTIRRTFTGSENDLWRSDVFGLASPSNTDEWWATNGTDVPVRWNGTDTQVELMTSLGFTCKELRVFKNMMLFFNLVQSGTAKPTDMINSNVGEPQNVTTGLASQFHVSDAPHGIIGAEILGDNVAIYTEKDDVTIAQFQGDPVVFIFRTAIANTGAIAARAIANFGNYHEFVGPDSLYVFDGVTVKEINSHVWRKIIRTVDPVRASLAFHHFDDENGELIWAVPLTTDTEAGAEDGSIEKAYVEHYLEGQEEQDKPTPYSSRDFTFSSAGFFFREDGLTWADLTQTWESLTFRWNDRFFFAVFPLSIVGDANGKIYTLNTANTKDGTSITSFVEFGRRALGDGRIRGLLARVYPFTTELAGNFLTVTVKLYDHAMGNVDITDAQTYDLTLAQGEHFTVHYRRGRFYSIQFGTAGDAWELAGYDVDMRSGGRR